MAPLCQSSISIDHGVSHEVSGGVAIKPIATEIFLRYFQRKENCKVLSDLFHKAD